MEKGTGGDGKRVLGICCKRQRSVLIHDAEKDTQMRGIKFRSFLSALCVPIFDQDKSLLGAFLMIAEKPEVFTNEHKFALERAARDYGPTLAGMRRVTQTEEEKEETGERFKLLFSPVVLGFTACALMLLGIWLLPPRRLLRQPPPLSRVRSRTKSRMSPPDFLPTFRKDSSNKPGSCCRRRSANVGPLPISCGLGPTGWPKGRIAKSSSSVRYPSFSATIIKLRSPFWKARSVEIESIGTGNSKRSTANGGSLR